MPSDQILKQGRELVDSFGQNGQTLAAIKSLLVYGYPLLLTALLVLTVAAAAGALPALIRSVRRISASGWAAALAVFDAALALRAFWTPHLPQVYFDEISFLSTADAMARHGVNAVVPEDGGTLGGIFHPCPQAWQFLVSLLYRLLGVHVDLAFALAAVLSALTVLLLFLAVFEMTGRPLPALAAAGMLAVLPIHLRLSGSAALETASLFFLAALLYGLTAWMRERDGALLLLVACLAAWFVNVRMENGIALFPLLLVYFAAFCPSEALRGRRQRAALVGAAALIVIFAVPAILSDYYGLATRFYFFYAPAEVIQTDVRSNLGGNLTYWIDNAIHPAAFTVLALFGLAAVRRRLAAFWAAWFGILVAFYTVNPSCDFALRHTLDSWRTALHPAFGLLILAGLGVDVLARRLGRRGRALAAGALVALCAAAPVCWAGFIQDRHVWMVQWEQMRDMRACLGAGARVLVDNDLPVHGLHPASLAYEMGCAAGVRPSFFALPRPDAPHVKGPPAVVEAARRWIQVEKRAVFLYHFGTGTVEYALTMSALRRLFDLRAVSGRSVVRFHASFALYRVEEPPPMNVSSENGK